MFHSWRFLIMVAAVSTLVSAQNVPPVVDAGRDSTTRLGADFRLQGEVADDGLLDASPTVLWTPVSGLTGGLVISWIDYPHSKTEPREIGVYKLELSASDGEFTSRDTVTITVLDSIPFLILSPTSGQSMSPGDSLLITWQVDPLGSSVLLQYSLDGGLNWEWIVDVGISNETRYSWHIPNTLSAPNNVAIRARVKLGYRFTPIVTVALASSGSKARINMRKNLRAGVNQEVFSIDGKLLDATSSPGRLKEECYGVRVTRSAEASASVSVHSQQ